MYDTMSFIVNGQMYSDADDRAENDFMPHSWNNLGNQREHDARNDMYDRDDAFNNEQGDDDCDEEDEGEVSPAEGIPCQDKSAPPMPMDYYNKVENFLSRPAPVLVGGDGEKKSTVAKLPKISGGKKPSDGVNGSAGSNKARGKIEQSISASKQPLDANLLQQAFDYTDALLKANDAEEVVEQANTQKRDTGSSRSAGSGSTKKKGKRLTPEKNKDKGRDQRSLQQQQQMQSQQQKEMDAIYRANYDMYAAGGPGAKVAAANKKGVAESSDDLYVSLKQANKPVVQHSNSNASMGIHKKSHPYLDNPSTGGKKKGKSKKVTGSVSKLREQLLSHNRAEPFSNYNSHETVSSVNRDRELTKNNNTYDNMESLIENFTKGLTLNRLKGELEDSKRSLERSNQFMAQLAQDVQVMKK